MQRKLKKERMVVVKEVSAEQNMQYDELVFVLCSVYIQRENDHVREKVGELLISPSTHVFKKLCL